MLMQKHILCVKHQDWFGALDMKDPYFYVLILPWHRPFLWFAFEGQAYQYKVLPFGLHISPCVFTEVAEAAVASWQQLWGHCMQQACSLDRGQGDGTSTAWSCWLCWWTSRGFAIDSNKHVLVRTDNTAMVAYIIFQRGMHSCHMLQLVSHLLKSLWAIHIPGDLNRPAKHASMTGCALWRVETLYPGSPADMESVQQRTGRSVCFAGALPIALCGTPWLELCPVWMPWHTAGPRVCSNMHFTQWVWSHIHCARSERHQILMVAAYWPTWTWFSELMLLSAALPWWIPLRKDLHFQGKGTIWYPLEHIMTLWMGSP